MGDPGEEAVDPFTKNTRFGYEATSISASGSGQSITNDTATAVTLGIQNGTDELDAYDSVNFPNELRLYAGAFLVQGNCYFAANATGYRYGFLYNVSLGLAAGAITNAQIRLAASPTLNTFTPVFSFIRADSHTKVAPFRIGMGVRHTSGAALTLDYAELLVVRLQGTKPI